MNQDQEKMVEGLMVNRSWQNITCIHKNTNFKCFGKALGHNFIKIDNLIKFLKKDLEKNLSLTKLKRNY
jgi:hypothetical protein